MRAKPSEKGMFDFYIDRSEAGRAVYLTLFWVITLGVRLPVFETGWRRHRGFSIVLSFGRVYLSLNSSYATHDKVVVDKELNKLVNLKEFHG